MDMITKTIWGENNARASEEEPVSGEQGAGTASDPYDKGNEEIQHEEDAKHANSSPTPAAAQRDGPSDAADNTGDPSSGAQPTQKQQGADRPAEDPPASGKPAMPHSDTEREALMKTGEFPHDPGDHSGEPMKMHGAPNPSSAGGGDGGDGDDAGEKKKTDRSASVAHEGGAPHGKTLGTGEKYVRSSGVVAEGGDFDAANPGAGAEATRLMEQAGLKSDGQKAPDEQEDLPSKDDADTEKHGKLSKLKEKLHIGKAH